jgi:hypothetical protein
MFRIRQLFISQAHFDLWANGTKRWHLYLLGAAMPLLAVCAIAAIAIMGPRLVREGSLLWFGTYTEGTVREMKVEEDGKFKGGAPKYRLTIDYHFTAENASRHDGSTIRTDVRDPPDLKPGDPIGVYYRPSNPGNSVAEHNLRTDVYALLLFLPFLAVMGIVYPLLWAWRWRAWHHRRSSSFRG